MGSEQSGGSRATVLIVDDDPAVRTMLARLLDAHGYEARVAHDADSATAIVERDRVDLVVTDVVMPGRSGLDLRRRLAEQQPRLPVILISGFSAEGPAEVAEQTPNTRFMQKPFAVDSLVDLISEMLGAQERR